MGQKIFIFRVRLGIFQDRRFTKNNYQGYIFEVEDCFIADAEGS